MKLLITAMDAQAPSHIVPLVMDVEPHALVEHVMMAAEQKAGLGSGRYQLKRDRGGGVFHPLPMKARLNELEILDGYRLVLVRLGPNRPKKRGLLT